MPVLWLFTDPLRTPDVLGAIAALPAGLCGVVFRHDDVPSRGALAALVARQCRLQGIPLVVAGDERLSGQVKAGVHLRGGRRSGRRHGRGLVTSSAHDRRELLRASRSGAVAIFLSPAFATASHPGAAGHGAVRWAALSRWRRVPVFALGGVSGNTAFRLPRWCSGVGAISALVASAPGALKNVA